MDIRLGVATLHEGFGSMMESESSVKGRSESKIVEHKTVDENNKTIALNRSLGYKIVKRLFDVAFSLVGIIVLSPILLITIIAIKIEDKGPAFFTQNRIGADKKPFKMFKFRSMKLNAAEIHEQMKKDYGWDDISFKLKEDPRVTKVGKFIRKTNIDELPQLVNILLGNMSFVGPRPLPDYEFKEEQESYNGKYDARYAVPQGLTCIWQISNRSEPSFAERMQMDVDYAEKCGLGMDIKLFFQTALYSIFGKAAY